MKVWAHFILICLLIVSITGQNYLKRSGVPAEHGRTLGLIRPLLGLGLGAIAGFNDPIVPAAPYRPASASTAAHSDSYYGNYGYNPNGGYLPYRPAFPGLLFPSFGAYRPQLYPVNYGSFAQYNPYGSQRPVYNNLRPRPTAQGAIAAQQQPQPAAYPSSSNAAQAGSATTNPLANNMQAAQIANLLGQLLGQQLRPLLNQGSASTSHDDPDDPDEYHKK